VAPDVVEAHRIFGRMVLFFDRKSGWPLLMETLSPDGTFMEKVEYENCRKNVVFPPGFFRM
jgi:outer membrane lipoprotein-sorting protein